MGAHEKQSRKDYDWIDDPFDEKKAAAEQEQARTSGGTRLVLGIGCGVVIVAIIVIVVLLAMGIMSIAPE